jgi:hypothetical protein
MNHMLMEKNNISRKKITPLPIEIISPGEEATQEIPC